MENNNMDSIIERRKNFKRNKILNVIRYSLENVSRFEIKKMTEYSMSTVSNIIGDLLSDNLIYEDNCVDAARVGRKPTWLHLNPKGGYFIGIEFNIQKMHCTILNFTGELIYSNTILVPKSISTNFILNSITDMIGSCYQFLKTEKTKILGIGFGLPGYIDINKGIALNYAYLKDWKNVPIKQIIEEKYGVPCYIQNNVDGMALAYKWLEYNGVSENFIFVSIRTGVRMVPILNNQPYFGENGSGGELGHILIHGNDKLCSCGKRGCLNTQVSDLSIQQKIIDGIKAGKYKDLYEMASNNLDNVNVQLLVQSALSGHVDSLLLLKETARILGSSLAIIVNLLAPSKIILSGELSKAGKLFIEPMDEIIKAETVETNYNHLSIIISSFSDNIGAIGAAALVMQQEFEIVSSDI